MSSVRAKVGMKMLTESAHMQWYVADILEAKAQEMETLREWVLATVKPSNIKDVNSFITQSSQFHTHLIEVLHGITKMEYGLAKHVHQMIEEEQAIQPFGAEGMMMEGEGL